MRIFRRAFAGAELPVSFSQGFNPHPRLSFGPSLRTGWESFDEYMDVLLETPADEIPDRCNRLLPEGLRILEAAGVAPSVPKLAADVSGARFVVRLEAQDVFEKRADFSQPLLDSVTGDAADNESSRRAHVLLALAESAKIRFSPGGDRNHAPPGGTRASPSILDVRISQNDGETGAGVSLEYLSTMHGGKCVFPEEILTPLLGDPSDYRTPLRVLRKSLYVERGGEFVSPMSRAALETAV